MAPPPEPMASTRNVGTLIGWWLITVVVARTGSPSTTSPARNVVPPTSVEMMLRWPSWRPSATDPTTPPVRTDPTVLIAEAGASCAATAPPLDCITSSGPASSRSRSAASSEER